MRDQHNTGAISETTQTWKTIRTIHAPIHSNKANMKRWLWRPNDIRGTCEPKASWHLSHGWWKTPKKPHPGSLSRPGIEQGPLRDRRACYRLLHSGRMAHVSLIKIKLLKSKKLHFTSMIYICAGWIQRNFGVLHLCIFSVVHNILY